MEIGLWRFLVKAKDAADPAPLALRQRIPAEVALFKGPELQACYFQDANCRVQERDSSEVTPEKVIERLLGSASRAPLEQDADAPVAIMRCQAEDPSSPPTSTVVSEPALRELLDQQACGGRAPRRAGGAEWSLQSLVTPDQDLRIEVHYTRTAQDSEVKVVGRSFKAKYPGRGERAGQGAGLQLSGPSPADEQLPRVPEAVATQVRAKNEKIIEYMQEFHSCTVGSLVTEFLVDASGKAILHAFLRASPGSAEDLHRPPRGVFARDSRHALTAPDRSTLGDTGFDISSLTATFDISGVERDLNDVPIVEDDGEGEDFERDVELARAAAGQQPRPSSAAPASAAATEGSQAPGAAAPEGARPGGAAPSAAGGAAAPGGAARGSRLGAPAGAARPASAGQRAQVRASAGAGVTARPGSAGRRSARAPPAEAADARAAVAPEPARPGGDGASGSRPASAGRRRPSAPSAPVAGGRSEVSTQSVSKAPGVIIHSKQLISRFDAGKDFKPRLLSTLVRQLERYRELLPLWVEQRKAIDVIMMQTDQTLEEHRRKATFLLEERERLDRAYNKKHDDLVAHLTQETAKAAAEAASREAELKAVLDEEHEVTERLRAEQAKNQALQTTLDQTLARLSSVRVELQQCQAAMGELIGVPAASITGQQAGPGGLRLEALRLERDQVRAQVEAARRDRRRQEDEQASLKRSIEKAEAFVLRLTTSSQYAVDRKTKREGLRLLRMPAKRAQSPQGSRSRSCSSGSAAPTFSRPGSARRLSGPRGSAPCFSEAAGAELGEGQDPLLTAQATWRDGLRA